MKRILLAVLLVCILALPGCMCMHRWEEATCSSPRLCTACGKTEGAPLGHNWAERTCETPKTCLSCGKTRGEALGHAWTEATCLVPQTCSHCGKTQGVFGYHSWTDADCTSPRTCSVCGKEDGIPLGHSWVEATTELPKHCTVCRITEGNRILTDPRFTTASAQPLFGFWQSRLSVTGADVGYPDLTASLNCLVSLRLGDRGDMEVTVTALNMEEFKVSLNAYAVDVIYREFASRGLNKTAADVSIRTLYGMSVSQYADSIIADMDIEGMIAAFNRTGVYYVADGKVYYSHSWEGKMDASSYTLADSRLTLHALAMAYGKTLTFDRDAETPGN